LVSQAAFIKAEAAPTLHSLTAAQMKADGHTGGQEGYKLYDTADFLADQGHVSDTYDYHILFPSFVDKKSEAPTVCGAWKNPQLTDSSKLNPEEWKHSNTDTWHRSDLLVIFWNWHLLNDGPVWMDWFCQVDNYDPHHIPPEYQEYYPDYMPSQTAYKGTLNASVNVAQFTFFKMKWYANVFYKAHLWTQEFFKVLYDYDHTDIQDWSTWDHEINEHFKLLGGSLSADQKYHAVRRPLRITQWDKADAESYEMGKYETLNPGIIFSLAHMRIDNWMKDYQNQELENDNLSTEYVGRCKCPTDWHPTEGDHDSFMAHDILEAGVYKVHADTDKAEGVACIGGIAELWKDEGVERYYKRIVDDAHNLQPKVIICHQNSTPMHRYDYQKKQGDKYVRRAQIDVAWSIYQHFPDLGSGRNCAHEGNYYQYFKKRRQEADYDCGLDGVHHNGGTAIHVDAPGAMGQDHYADDHTVETQAGDFTVQTSWRELKVREDMGKNFALVYRFFDWNGYEAYARAKTEYRCERHHLNAFLLDSDANDDSYQYAYPGNSTWKLFPFVCYATHCPTFKDIDCQGKCKEEQICINHMYKGKSVASLLFTAEHNMNFESAKEYLVGQQLIALAQVHYGVVRAYKVNPNHSDWNSLTNANAQVDEPICWPQWHATGANDYSAGPAGNYVTGNTSFGNGLELVTSTANCDADRTDDQQFAAAKFCEDFDSVTKLCNRCYQNFTLILSQTHAGKGWCYDYHKMQQDSYHEDKADFHFEPIPCMMDPVDYNATDCIYCYREFGKALDRCMHMKTPTLTNCNVQFFPAKTSIAGETHYEVIGSEDCYTCNSGYILSAAHDSPVTLTLNQLEQIRDLPDYNADVWAGLYDPSTNLAQDALNHRQRCVKNTICNFKDERAQETCLQLNSKVTHMHMDGCRVLSTNVVLRDLNAIEPSNASAESWDGEWRCAECKPGYFQKSVMNEYCAPLLTAEMDRKKVMFQVNQHQETNQQRLKECLESNKTTTEHTSRAFKCWELGITKGDKRYVKQLQNHLNRFLGAYQLMLADRKVIKQFPGLNFVCQEKHKQSSWDSKCFRYWIGDQLGWSCTPSAEDPENITCKDTEAWTNTGTNFFDDDELAHCSGKFGAPFHSTVTKSYFGGFLPYLNQYPEPQWSQPTGDKNWWRVRLFGHEWECDEKDVEFGYCHKKGDIYSPMHTIADYLADKPNPWTQYYMHEHTNKPVEIDAITNWILYHRCPHNEDKYYFGGNPLHETHNYLEEPANDYGIDASQHYTPLTKDSEDWKIAGGLEQYFGQTGLPGKYKNTEMIHHESKVGEEWDDYMRKMLGKSGTVQGCNNSSPVRDDENGLEQMLCDIDVETSYVDTTVSGPNTVSTEGPQGIIRHKYQSIEEHGTGNEVYSSNHPDQQ
jgi:hypothetical protein